MISIKYVGLQYTMFFEPINDIREHSSIFEKKLKEHFSSGFNILPNVENVPLEIPRMIGSNNEQKLVLSISSNSAIVQKRAEIDDIDGEINKVRNIIEILDGVIKSIGGKHLFSGLVIQGNLIIEQDAVEYLKEKFLNIETNDKLFDLLAKITFVEDEKYYVNISLNNIRNIELTENKLGIELDINDRYRYNFKKADYPYSDNNVIDKIYSILDNVLKEKLDKLLDEGTY